MDVGALVWLLVFVFVIALVYAGVRWMGVPIHPRLEQLMIGLVALIVLVVLVAWLLSLVGWSGHWMRGPRLP